MAGASTGNFGIVTAVQAAPLTARQALSRCPDLDAARACPAVARAFMAGRASGPETDARIVNLVLALADAVQDPGITTPICRNTADGLRTLARGISNARRARQVRSLANDLCGGSRGVGAGGPPASIFSGGSGKKAGGDNLDDTADTDPSGRIREDLCQLPGGCP